MYAEKFEVQLLLWSLPEDEVIKLLRRHAPDALVDYVETVMPEPKGIARLRAFSEWYTTHREHLQKLQLNAIKK